MLQEKWRYGNYRGPARLSIVSGIRAKLVISELGWVAAYPRTNRTPLSFWKNLYGAMLMMLASFHEPTVFSLAVRA